MTIQKPKRCGGYKGHWECSEDYPDHNKVPRSEFGTHSGQTDGLQGRCRKCMDYSNTKRPRHPETDELKMDWKTARAKEYYGGVPKAKRANPIGPLGIPWKECLAMADKDSESIAWVIPAMPNESVPPEPMSPAEGKIDNVIAFKAKPNFTNSYEEVTTVSKGRKRDQKVVAHIKDVYDTCSVEGCDYPLYDVAHIHALKHGADDLPGNCIPLCPNHHRDLDRGRLLLADPADRSATDPIVFLMGEEEGRIILDESHDVDSKYIEGCIREIDEYLSKRESY